jgi:hypothetical protein
VIDESDSQYAKHFDPRISTFLGIKIDSSDDDENADDSIRFNREFDSNVIDESDSQYAKHFDPRVSTLIGMKSDSSDESANAKDSIRINLELISNKTHSISFGFVFVFNSGFITTIEFGIQAKGTEYPSKVDIGTVSTRPIRTITRRQ